MQAAGNVIGVFGDVRDYADFLSRRSSRQILFISLAGAVTLGSAAITLLGITGAVLGGLKTMSDLKSLLGWNNALLSCLTGAGGFKVYGEWEAWSGLKFVLRRQPPADAPEEKLLAWVEQAKKIGGLPE